jgi:hypothetical protein
MNYFDSLPVEIYKEALFAVSPGAVEQMCNIDRRALSICDERFYKEYIQRNFDPKFYGLEEFTLPEHLKWKTFLNILVDGITILGEIISQPDKSVVSKISLNIRFEDRLKNIWDNVKKIVADKCSNMMLLDLKLIGTSKDKKVFLIMEDYLAEISLDEPTSPVQMCNPFAQMGSMDAQITKINFGEFFYFGLEKICVYIGEYASQSNLDAYLEDCDIVLDF